MTGRRHNFCCLLLIFLGTVLGCERREKQSVWESRTVFWIMKLHDLHQAKYPSTSVTNVSQLFVFARQDYPHEFHRVFESYGKHAGFTNSFYEKYVFFPPGIRHPWVEGELFLMNARPFPDYDGFRRNLVSKSEKGLHWTSREEHVIQRILKEARISEPQPSVMPPPPSAPREAVNGEPLRFRISNSIMRVGVALGLNDDQALILRNIVFAVPLLALPTLVICLWRRRSAGQGSS